MNYMEKDYLIFKKWKKNKNFHQRKIKLILKKLWCAINKCI